MLMIVGQLKFTNKKIKGGVYPLTFHSSLREHEKFVKFARCKWWDVMQI